MTLGEHLDRPPATPHPDSRVAGDGRTCGSHQPPHGRAVTSASVIDLFDDDGPLEGYIDESWVLGDFERID